MNCPDGVTTGAIRGIIASLLLIGVAAMPAWAAPCLLLSNEASPDIQPCLSEPPAADGLRRLRIELSWAGPGVIHRVLDLRVPDVLALTMRQQAVAADGSMTGPPLLLQALRADSAYAERVLPSPRIAVPLSLAPGRHRIELDYRIHLDGRLYPRLDDDAGWRARNALGDMFSGMQWGLMLASLLLAVMTRVLAKTPVNWAYAALVAVHGAGLVQIRGDAFAYLWPQAPLFNQGITVLAVSLVLCTHAWFATQFLDLRERWPPVYRLHLLLLALLGLNLLLQRGEAAAAGAGVLALAYAALAFAVSWRSLRSAAADARLYTAGTASYVLFTIVLFVPFAAGHNPWPGFDFLVLPEIGYMLETACLGAAMVWRVRRMQQRQAAAREQQLQDAQGLIEAESARLAAHARAERNTLLLAGAGHDLSQPLASLRMALSALQLPQGQEPVAHHLERTIAYAQTLLRDMLAEARNEHRAHDDRVSLGDCITQVVRAHAGAAAAKGLALRVVDTQVEVRASSLLLARVLHNLVGNAVRYTPRGRVLVGVRRRAGGVELQVLDTGPGLRPDQLQLLQQPFQQGTAAAAEGHGLGLFIVRTLCEQSGFRLRVASRVGRGCAFCVWVPLGPAGEPGPQRNVAFTSS